MLVANFDTDPRYQWRTLTITVGEAKSYYITVKEANLKCFIFYIVKKDKY
jgi:hypothetical protein